ncbi:hypothetical protein TrVFT333_002677 [Trichoderma virens FT-333]|nr:hypothetical protein TrVFT333_002677 [Trichoderma virens FT-333]
MRYYLFLYLAALSSLANGYEVSQGHVVRHATERQKQDTQLEKRMSCGSGVGSCPSGQCCSESGFCGTTEDYCQAPQCQIAYSNGSCDANQMPAGQSTKSIPRNTNGKAPYNVYITNCTHPGNVALTFDDGPYNYTTQLLNILDSFNVKATFFIVGNNLGKGPIDVESNGWAKILRRMYRSGHQLGSHTWGHADLSAASSEIREQQIIYNEMAFRNIFGFFPTYLRPPYGTCSRDSGCLDYVTSLGYHVVNWNIDTKDYLNDSPQLIGNSKAIFYNALASANPKHDGFISLSHDTHEQTVISLTAYMIKTLRSKGFRPVTVGECLGDPRSNWYTNAR